METETEIREIKRYLLGGLTPPEMEAFDLQIIAESDSEEKLSWAESELIEDYLDATLSPPEVVLFEQNFLVSSERQTQMRQLSLLKHYARQAAATEVLEKVGETPPESFLEKLKRNLSLNLLPATAVFALVVVGLFAAVFYSTIDKQTVSEKEFAAINHQDLSDLAELKPLAAISLTSGVFRDSSDLRRLAASQLTEKVLFRLALPVQSGSPDKFKSELVTDGKVIFTQNQLPFYTNSSGREVRLLLPSTELKKGTYQIRLASENAKNSILTYSFAIV